MNNICNHGLRRKSQRIMLIPVRNEEKGAPLFSRIAPENLVFPKKKPAVRAENNPCHTCGQAVLSLANFVWIIACIEKFVNSFS